MLLVIDIGNTNIKLGVFDGDKLIQSWRLSVKVPRTADEFGVNMLALFNDKNIEIKDIEGIIMSSVAPTQNYTIEHVCEYYFKIKPLVVGSGIKTGMHIRYANPQEVGADRIVNSVAAYKLYGGPCIVVDFGTATTFNFISENGEFMGGCIAPGINASLESLVNNTAKLPRIELHKPDSVICKSSISNMQAGMIYGFTGLVKYIVERMKEDSGCPNAKVIATGGLSELVRNVDKSKIIDKIDRYLTLNGLRLIYEMNTNK